MQKTLLLSVLSILFLASCHQAEQANAIEFKTGDEQTMAPVQAEPNSTSTTTVNSSILSQRKIIRKGSMRIETDDYAKTRAAITGIVAQWDAFVAQENE
ncbi:MAG: hypothetical protein AAFQ68_26480, partial [Bacteroidota bacterium]